MHFCFSKRVTPYDCAMLKFNADLIALLEMYGAVKSQVIKECAAMIIQVNVSILMSFHMKINAYT